MGARLLEITDLLWPVDADGALVPVAKADVLNRLWAGGQDRAMTLSNDLEVAIMAGLSVVAVLAVDRLPTGYGTRETSPVLPPENRQPSAQVTHARHRRAGDTNLDVLRCHCDNRAI